MSEALWDRDPPDGVRCLVSTRRVLDRFGHCCDYNRCGAYTAGGKRRCLMDQGHPGERHTSDYRQWWEAGSWAAGRPPAPVIEDPAVELGGLCG